MSAGPVGVAVVGCGQISHQYLRNLTRFPDVRVIACVDKDPTRAKAAAEQYGVPIAGQDVSDPDIELVVNLTIPAAHDEVARQAVSAGRHVYNEKPLVLDLASGAELLAAANAAGVRVGGAPDTFLGAGLQTLYRLLASGEAGEPHSAVALLQSRGPMSHHNPEFFFQPGAGPLWDMGPYYLTALAVAFGPVIRVSATATTGAPHRVIAAGPRAGVSFAVETPTHVSALLEYAGGQTAALVFSWESPLTRHDFFELTGTSATVSVPNPNRFDGEPRLLPTGTTIPSQGPAHGRGIGVLDMARAIRTGTPHRASAELALHVVEVMTAALASAQRGVAVPVTSTFSMPSPLPTDWEPLSHTL